MRNLLLLCLATTTCIGQSQTTPPQPYPPIEPAYDRIVGTKEAAKLNVDAIFSYLEQGKYSEIGFPKVLNWSSVPELLVWAKSTRVLGHPHKPGDKSLQVDTGQVPMNFISSHLQASCTEGMVALWFIEGVRKGGDFASLNPLCVPANPKHDLINGYEESHPKALAAYQAWWNKVKVEPAKLGPTINPLAGTGLHWY